MPHYIVRNDRMYPLEGLPLEDRALAYGDGLFETIAIAHHGPRLLSFHLARLHSSCEQLLLPPPPACLEKILRQLAQKYEYGVVKLIYSRGSSPRGYALPPTPAPRLILSVTALPSLPCHQEGVRLRYGEFVLGSSPRLAGIKHLNRLEQVLARSEWNDPAIFESLLCDEAGHIIEGVMSNLFIVRGGALHTPSLERAGVAGVMRAWVMAQGARLNIPCTITHLTRGDIDTCDELFLTNALIGIAPVIRLEDKIFTIGALTQRLQKEMKNM